MNREKVIELLKKYRSYKYAVRMYENSKGIPSATTATYDDMPRTSSFGSRMPRVNDGITLADHMDYTAYKTVVDAIEGAVNNVLNTDEQIVIKRKYLDQNTTTLYNIAIQRDVHECTTKRWHKDALRKLSDSFALLEVPHIQEIKIPA